MDSKRTVVSFTVFLALAPWAALPRATGGESVETVLEDEFDGTVLDPGRWDSSPAGIMIAGDGRLRFTGDCPAMVRGTAAVAPGAVLVARIESPGWRPHHEDSGVRLGFETSSEVGCRDEVSFAGNGHLLARSFPDAFGNCRQGPAYEEAVRVPYWDVLSARQILWIILIWTPPSAVLRVTDGSISSDTVWRGREVPSSPLVVQLHGGKDEPCSVDLVRVEACARPSECLHLPAGEGTFLRGDANGDGAVDISDAIFTVLHLVTGEPVRCADSADATDDGRIDPLDALRLLEHIYLGADLPPPFPGAGRDPTGDALGCASWGG